MKRHAAAALWRGVLPAIIILVAASMAGAAENATVTGSRVSLRAQPGAFARVLDTLDKGTRVEVLFVAGFSETVDGRDGSWCAVAHGGETGFIFSPYVLPDSGPIAPIEGPAYDRKRDLPLYFAETIRHLFGTDEAAVRARLGEPASRSVREWGKCEGVTIRTFEYPRVEIEIFYPTERCGFASRHEFLSGVTIAGDDRRILGIGVGSRLEEVRDTLGWGFEDLALRSDLYELHYIFEDIPEYIIDIVYRKILKGDAVAAETVTEVRFGVNVLGD